MTHRKQQKGSKSKKKSFPGTEKLNDSLSPPPMDQSRDFATLCQICGIVHEQCNPHHFEYTEEVNDDLLCEICMQPLVDPVDTPCRHTFCYLCLTNHMRLRQSCPIDRSPVTPSDVKPSSVIVRRMVGKIFVLCPNRTHCRKVVPRSNLQSHLKSCPGTMVYCPNRDQGCNYSSPQCLLEHHLWDCLKALGNHHSEIVTGVETWLEIPAGCSTPVGLSIIGGSDSTMKSIMIQSIELEGTAAKDGRLKPGDTILEIDGCASSLMNYTEASHFLHSATPLVRLKVLRGVEQDLKAVLSDADIEVAEISRSGETNTFNLELAKHKTLPGVYVLNMKNAFVNTGDLCVADRILDIDGRDTRYMTIEETENILSQTGQDAKLLVSRVPHIMRVKIQADLVTAADIDVIQTDPAYEEIPAKEYKAGDTKTVVLQKSNDEFFGMNVAGGTATPKGDLPVFISGIRSGGVIDKSPYIQRGDIILSINNHSLLQKTHEEAVDIIKANVTSITVQLKLIQGDPYVPDPGLSNQWTKWIEPRIAIGTERDIVLMKDKNMGLGFSIVGGKNSARGDCPLYVKKVLEESIAGLDGRLCEGDVIKSINNIPVNDWTQQDAVLYIKECDANLFLHVASSGTLNDSKSSSL